MDDGIEQAASERVGQGSAEGDDLSAVGQLPQRGGDRFGRGEPRREGRAGDVILAEKAAPPPSLRDEALEPVGRQAGEPLRGVDEDHGLGIGRHRPQRGAGRPAGQPVDGGGDRLLPGQRWPAAVPPRRNGARERVDQLADDHERRGREPGRLEPGAAEHGRDPQAERQRVVAG